MADADPSPESPGLFASARRLGATLVAAVQNRIELLSVELHEEKCRLVEILILAGVVLGTAGMAAVLLAFTVVYLFGAEFRPYVLGALCLAFLAAAGTAAWRLRGCLRRRPPPFSDSIAQLKKDTAWLHREK
jgi:uncharacterized membrane protein YqjE